MHVAIHTNPTQRHQREHAQWLKAGLKRHNIDLIETHDIDYNADVHIVSGPHYAKDRWLNHPRVILLDRAYYHQERCGKWQSMDYISLGWMRSDGGRDFIAGSGREKPQCKIKDNNGRSIFLTDYGCKPEPADGVRFHPADRPEQQEITQVLRDYGIAIGYQTSALVTAALEGLQVICKDKRNIMYNNDWLELLPYADWHYSEMDEAMEHLMQGLL